MSDRYITAPGGVLLQTKAGSSEHYKYGQKVDVDSLSEVQADNLDGFTASKSPKGEDDIRQELIREANERAAFAEAGQPGSTSSAVPGNYDELDEDAAARFVASLESPADQAQVLVRERMGESRSLVLNSASKKAQEIADQLVDDLESGPSGDTQIVREEADTSALEKQIEELQARLDAVESSDSGDAKPAGKAEPKPSKG